MRYNSAGALLVSDAATSAPGLTAIISVTGSAAAAAINDPTTLVTPPIGQSLVLTSWSIQNTNGNRQDFEIRYDTTAFDYVLSQAIGTGKLHLYNSYPYTLPVDSAFIVVPTTIDTFRWTVTYFLN